MSAQSDKLLEDIPKDKNLYISELARIDNAFLTGQSNNGEFNPDLACDWLDKVCKVGSVWHTNNEIPYKFKSTDYRLRLVVYRYDKIEYDKEMKRLVTVLENGNTDKDKALTWIKQIYASTQGHWGELPAVVVQAIGDFIMEKNSPEIAERLNSPSKNDLARQYGTFSGSDMLVSVVFPNCKPIVIGELTTGSYSTYRDKRPVRTCGRITPKGFTLGPRTVAGTLIFTVFEKHIVNRIRKEVPYLATMVKLKPDELPPFDVYITMANEYGASAKVNIYGVTIVDEGKVFSVEDLFTENQWSYMAQDIDLLDSIGSEMNREIPGALLSDSNEKSGMFNLNELVSDNTMEGISAQMDSIKMKQEMAIKEARSRASIDVTYSPSPGGVSSGNQNTNSGGNSPDDPNKEQTLDVGKITFKDWSDSNTVGKKSAYRNGKLMCLRAEYEQIGFNEGIPEVKISVSCRIGDKKSNAPGHLTNGFGRVFADIEKYNLVKPTLVYSINVKEIQRPIYTGRANMIKRYDKYVLVGEQTREVPYAKGNKQVIPSFIFKKVE